MFGYGYRGFGGRRYQGRARWPHMYPGGWRGCGWGNGPWMGGPGGYWGAMDADYGPYPQDYSWDAGVSQDEIAALRQEVNALRAQVEEALNRLTRQES
ncbi:MAG: hypothetical protein JW981_01115 [Anaerolineae bacterium]|nr:hypothetical protein [Anaerolineae bacterium]